MAAEGGYGYANSYPENCSADYGHNFQQQRKPFSRGSFSCHWEQTARGFQRANPQLAIHAAAINKLLKLSIKRPMRRSWPTYAADAPSPIRA
jgi:hypothetical protein